ncbi:hypothetical protein ACB092_02G054800 [Castanea dentata]
MFFFFFVFKTQEIEIHTQSIPLHTILIPQRPHHHRRHLFPKPEILYSQHCNGVVPKPHLSSGNVPFSLSDDFLRFEFAFFSGGIGIFNPSYIQSFGFGLVETLFALRATLVAFGFATDLGFAGAETVEDFFTEAAVASLNEFFTLTSFPRRRVSSNGRVKACGNS